MKIDKKKGFTLFALTLLIASLLLVNTPVQAQELQLYWKPSYPDYAPSGMPDFNQRQDQWNATGQWTWCAPTAVANSLWWLDSELHPSNLVTAYPGAVSEHDPSNVMPLISDLAWWMDTDGQRTGFVHVGTWTVDIQNGINQYLINHGVSNQFYVQLVNFPNFTYVENEVEKCEDVVLVLGFWMWTGTTWYRPTQEYEQGSGHCVTVAGINSTTLKIAISDPDNDAFHDGLIAQGRVPVPHLPYPHNSSVHNDASLVSQDIYNVNVTLPVQPPIPVGTWALKGYAGAPPGTIAVVEAAVITSPLPPPQQPELYWKPSYPDYAPSGVPDFYQRQDLFNVTGMWTWCVPTAVANSLWWMDSRFDYHPNGSRLLTNYTAGIDDHDPKNVQPFIRHLAYLMDTDGIRTQSGLTVHFGTLVLDMQTGIAQYLSWTGVNPLGDVNGDGVTNQTDYNIALAANHTQPGVAGWNMAADIYPVTTGWPTPRVADNVVNQSDLDLINAHMNETGMFYEKTVKTPDFQFVEDEVERCEDVILLLDFYNENWQKTTNQLKELGHAVTVAGVNSTTLKIAISDPDMDNAEPPPQGTSGPGRVLPEGVTHVHNATPPDTLHNNASYVSHDIYNVTFFMVPPPPHITNASWALDKYPVSVYAVVEWAVIVSPLAPVEVCGVDITNVTVSFKGVVVPGGYVTWGADPNAPFPVNVTVHNNGTITTNCTVNVYCYNATGTFQIGSAQNITDLAPSNNVTLTFNWNMSSLTQNTTYTLKANATCVCGASDEFIYGPVKVRLSGDINDDNRVSIADVKIMDNIYSGVPGIDPVTRAFGDINGDCRVSIADSKIMDNVYSGLPYP